MDTLKLVKKLAAALILVVVGASSLSAQITTNQLLDTLQHTAFNFFWNEANPSNGLIKDRSAQGVPSSIASVGFGLTAICIGADHGWVTRAAARERIAMTLQTFWSGPQGTGESGYAGYKGFFFHFLNMTTATRDWNSELSTIDSGLLFAGILYVREYFNGSDSVETRIRALADSIYFRADWEWFRNYNPGLLMEWKPVTNFGQNQWRGYNEAMIMYILAYGSPTHPITDDYGWQAWTGGYSNTIGAYYGQYYIGFAPLFGHQYSHCWVDFRNIRDGYMQNRGWDYFENSRRATLAQRAYARANPYNFLGYSDSLWGITACDGPNGYKARGAPGPGSDDDGTIAPTAAISSIVFAPEVVIPTIHNFWNTYRTQLWTQYGFRDAFNLTQNWWGPDVIGIDQGPIIIMIENYRTGKVWNVFKQSPYIKEGLSRIGFRPVVTNIPADNINITMEFRLHQNYPNPFNGQTNIVFDLPTTEWVSLHVIDMLGREVATLVHEVKAAGSHSVSWSSGALSSGIYFSRLQAGSRVVSNKMILLR